MKDIIIFGNQAVAIEAYIALTHYSEHKVVAFTVDADYIHDEYLYHLPVLPFEHIDSRFPPGDYGMLVAVGYVRNNKLRADRYQESKRRGYTPASMIAPTAVVAPDVQIGENCFIGHYCTISPNVQIGNNVIIGNHCTIGHDSIVADHNFFSNNVAVSGHVQIGEYCYFGTNCTLRNGISIAANCVIGAGALVLEHTEPKGVYLGSAASLLPISSDDLSLG